MSKYTYRDKIVQDCTAKQSKTTTMTTTTTTKMKINTNTFEP